MNLQKQCYTSAREAEISDSAFLLLLALGTPVFTFVVSGLLYAVLKFKVSGEPASAGAPIQTNRPFTWVWLAVTSALAIFVIFNPGIKGINELLADQNPDLTINVTARKWAWTFEYQDCDIALEDANELVLPVDKRVKFDVTSVDIIHSFWVPAFRMKTDAMPGQTNTVFVTPTQTGTFEDDFNIRLQCAELCGTGHTRMRVPVRILEQADFDAWVASQSAGQ